MAEKYEVYIGRTEQNRKKTYLVFFFDADKKQARKAAKRFFKCSEDHLGLYVCWIYRDKLWFEDPGLKGAKKAASIEYVNRRTE